MLAQSLQTALNALTAKEDAARLAKDARAVSEAYRTRTGSGARLVTRRGEAAAYAASRMPATYEAVRAALVQALRASGLQMKTLLDCGAGTGAASWAADDLLELEGVICAEREPAMRDVGQTLMQAGGKALSGAQWIDLDLSREAALPHAQLVVEGYMLGELGERDRETAAVRMWNAAEEMLLLVEPGTPQGFENLRRVRDALTARGAHVAAPCPAGAGVCPMTDGDWCHFAVRVPRTRLHRALKGGDAPYEDEKFCYLALTREEPKTACGARVLRHPQIAPGRISLALCTGEGRAERTVTKKDPLWKRARKLGAGDGL